MILYSIIMFLTTVLLGCLGMAIYRGHTHLIHSYHQTKVTDRKRYGRAFGKALFVVAAAPLISGVIALFGDTDAIVIMAVSVLIIGIAIGMGFLVTVQKKYH